MATEAYTRSELLVDPAWVDAHKDDPNVVIVDCEVEAAFARGHIPGSVLVPDNYEKNPDTGRLHLMNPEQFKAMCEGLGIGDDSLVITYDHSRSLTAARLWWALNTYGHTNTKILNGGWRAWINHGGAVDFGRAAKQDVTFNPKYDDSNLATVEDLKQACQIGDSIIWDVRSDGEWDGSNSRGNKRMGHVPGAVHLEWFNLLDSETNEFKPEAEILRILTEHGITPDKNVYTY